MHDVRCNDVRGTSSCHTRRRLLQVGSLSVLGLGLPELLWARSAAPVGRSGQSPATSCIFVVQYGGASHIGGNLRLARCFVPHQRHTNHVALVHAELPPDSAVDVESVLAAATRNQSGDDRLTLDVARDGNVHLRPESRGNSLRYVHAPVDSNRVNASTESQRFEWHCQMVFSCLPRAHFSPMQ